MEIREGSRHTFCFRVEIITNLTILFVSLYFKVPQRYESMLSRALNIHRHESKLDYVIFDLYVYIVTLFIKVLMLYLSPLDKSYLTSLYL